MPCNQFPSTQRRKAWVRITILFALVALAVTALPTASFAGTDTAGNVLATDNDAIRPASKVTCTGQVRPSTWTMRPSAAT